MASTSKTNADSGDSGDEMRYSENTPCAEENNSIVSMTEQEFQARIQQEVLKSISSLTGTLAPLLTQMKTSHDFTSNPVFSKIDKEDRLAGSKNFMPWKQRLELGLRSNGLSSFIIEELGADEDLSRERRIQLDAQALQYIRSTVSTEIANSLLRFNTAYAAFQHVARTFGNQSLQEKIKLELREMKLHFAEHYNPVKFVNDFDNIIAEHKALGTEFDPEVIVSKFLVRIDDKYREGHPYSIFYNTMLQCPKEIRTIEYVKQRFLDVDNRNCRLKHVEKRSFGERYDSRVKRPRTDGFKTRNDCTPKVSADKRVKTPTELFRMQKVNLTDLYSDEEIAKLRVMTREDKVQNRCGKCGTYFHRSSECKYNKKFCYSCHQFGHIVKECSLKKRGKTLPQDSKEMVIECSKIINFFDKDLSFIVDSGATHHAVFDKSILESLEIYEIPKIVKLASDKTHTQALGQGSLMILLRFGSKCHMVNLNSVQLVPELTENILSVQTFNNQFQTSITLNSNNGFIYSRKFEEKIGLIQLKHNLFRLLTKTHSQVDKQNSNQNYSHIDLSEINIFNKDKQSNIVLNKNSLSISKSKRHKKIKKLSPKQRELLISEGDLWHNRMGHISQNYLNKLKSNSLGMNDFIFEKTISNCKICALSKMTRKSFNSDREGAQHPCEIIHTDLIHFSIPTYIKQNKYILTVLDDYSRYLMIFVIKNKNEVSKCLDKAFVNFKTMFQPNHHFRFLRCDNGTEFICAKTLEVLRDFEIQIQAAEPYAHEHNGTIERLNRTLEERIRALLFTSGFPKSFWGLAAHCAEYLYNRTPHSAIDYLTPYEKAFNKQPKLHYLKIFGSRAYVLNETVPKGNKTAPRSSIQYLVGFTQTGYITFDPKTRKTNNCCSVKIDERILYKNDFPMKHAEVLTRIDSTVPQDDAQRADMNIPTHESIPHDDAQRADTSISTHESIPHDDAQRADMNIPTHESIPHDDAQRADMNIPTHESIPHDDAQRADIIIPTSNSISHGNDAQRADRDTNLTENEIEFVYINEQPSEENINSIHIHNMKHSPHEAGNFLFDKEMISLNEVPLSFKEAISSKSYSEWEIPIKIELESMEKHKVWSLVPKREDMNIVPVKWIFGIKPDGRKRARLVAVGCKDSESYSPSDKASPTPSADTIRWIFAHVSYSKIHLVQLDVKAAFLHGKLDRVKYICIPPGVEGDRKTQVCKLDKAMYGLVTAPRCWYLTLDKKMKELGFVRSCRESCLYTKTVETTVVLVLVYVDDILVTSSSRQLCDDFITSLSKYFEIKILGFPERFLGIDIHVSKNKVISLSQEKFLEEVLINFHMQESHPVKNPILRNVDYSKLVKNQTYFPFKRALGSLMWLANYTRPDITYATHYLARFQSNPTEEHWIMLKRIFRYLNGTRNSGITFDKRNENVIEAYVDSSYKDDPNTKKSTTGYLIRYHGNIISWKSRLQHSMAHSTTHAEYIAITDAATDIIFLARIIEESLDSKKNVFPVPIFEDNSSCLSQCENTLTRTQLKYIEKKYLDVKDFFDMKLLKVHKIDSKHQLADILTKPLTSEQFSNLSTEIISKITRTF